MSLKIYPDSKIDRGIFWDNKLNHRYIRELVGRYAKKASIEKHVNPHMLRPRAATRRLQHPRGPKTPWTFRCVDYNDLYSCL